MKELAEDFSHLVVSKPTQTQTFFHVNGVIY